MFELSRYLSDNSVDELKELKISELASNPKKPCPDSKPSSKSKGGKVALKCPKGMRDYTPDQVFELHNRLYAF